MAAKGEISVEPQSESLQAQLGSPCEPGGFLHRVGALERSDELNRARVFVCWVVIGFVRAFVAARFGRSFGYVFCPRV